MIRSAALLVASLLATMPASGSAVAITPKTVDAALAEAKATMLVDPAAALAKAEAAEQQSKQLPDDRNRAIATATADWLQAEALVRIDKPTLAMPIAARAFGIVRAIAPGTKLQADILSTRGGVYTDLNQVGPALGDYQDAFRIYRLIADQRGETIAMLNIAELYRQAQDYDRSLAYLNQANDLNRTDAQLTVSTFNNSAIILQKIGRYADAKRQLTHALATARNLGSPLLMAQIWRNLAQCQLKSDDLAGAMHSIAEGRSAARRAGSADDPIMLSVMAQAALIRGDRDEARDLVDRAFDGIDPTHTALSLREAHQTAYEVYRATDRPELALVHLAALKRLDDEATKLATTTSTALMAARFDFAKVKADGLQRSVEYERQKAKSDRFVFVVTTSAAVVVMMLLAFALFVSRRSRLRVAGVNADLADTNAALNKALAAKTEFLATTSHEIRTPLNGILGMTQVMLADGSIQGPTRERLGIVQGAGVTMRALVDDILDIAKMESGKLTIENAPFGLAQTLADAARLWDEQAKAKGVAFVVDLHDCPDHIVGDAARVRQILFNLLSNALKFTAAGTITFTAARAPDDRYRICVRDTGIGIPAAKTDEIFESFKQADAGTTRQFGGTGLGLAICRNLAHAMGGDIAVESAVGQGATFTVTLPLVLAQPADTGAADCGGADQLLIVDRNPITRAMLRALLEHHCQTIGFVASCEEAVGSIAARPTAIVIADDATVRLTDDPETALATLCTAAHAQGGSVTLLSSLHDGIDTQAAYRSGVDDVIAKPINGEALVAALFGSPKVANERLVSRAA